MFTDSLRNTNTEIGNKVNRLLALMLHGKYKEAMHGSKQVTREEIYQSHSLIELVCSPCTEWRGLSEICCLAYYFEISLQIRNHFCINRLE